MRVFARAVLVVGDVVQAVQGYVAGLYRGLGEEAGRESFVSRFVASSVEIFRGRLVASGDGGLAAIDGGLVVVLGHGRNY